MAKLATDIIELVDIINLHKKKAIKLKDFFEVFQKDRNLFSDDAMETEIREIIEATTMLDSDFGFDEIPEIEKNKRLLN